MKNKKLVITRKKFKDELEEAYNSFLDTKFNTVPENNEFEKAHLDFIHHELEKFRREIHYYRLPYASFYSKISLRNKYKKVLQIQHFLKLYKDVKKMLPMMQEEEKKSYLKSFEASFQWIKNGRRQFNAFFLSKKLPSTINTQLSTHNPGVIQWILNNKKMQQLPYKFYYLFLKTNDIMKFSDLKCQNKFLAFLKNLSAPKPPTLSIDDGRFHKYVIKTDLEWVNAFHLARAILSNIAEEIRKIIAEEYIKCFKEINYIVLCKHISKNPTILYFLPIIILAKFLLIWDNRHLSLPQQLSEFKASWILEMMDVYSTMLANRQKFRFKCPREVTWFLKKLSPVYTTNYIECCDLTDELAAGGFGKVYKFKELFAVKMIRPQYYDKLTFELVQREVSHLIKLNHPNIVKYYSSWLKESKEEDGWSDEDSLSDTYSTVSTISTKRDIDSLNKLNNGEQLQGMYSLCIQMELCLKTLKDHLSARNQSLTLIQDFSKEEKEAYSIACQLIIGVNYIHSEGIIHRDLKPENIFFDETLTNIKIGDFGLARNNDCLLTIPSTSTARLEDESLTKGVGTLMYAAPEQKTSSSYDKMVDLYSLGVIFLQLFYPIKTDQELVFKVKEMRELANDKVASILDSVIKSFVNNNPKQRSKGFQLFLSAVKTRFPDLKQKYFTVENITTFSSLRKISLFENFMMTY